MALVAGKCPLCGAAIRVPDSQEKCFCAVCGEQIISDAAVSFALAQHDSPSKTTTNSSDISRTVKGSEDASNHSLEKTDDHSQVVAEQRVVAVNSFLQQWETKGGLVVLGIFTMGAIGAALNTLMRTDSWLISFLASIAIAVAVIVYSFVVYPSYFKEDGSVIIESNSVASFMNGFIGGLIGCLWCSNMTNKKKGISHIVVGILNIIGLVLLSLFLAGVLS